MTAVEPPTSTWRLPNPRTAAAHSDLLAVGADLSPGTLLSAYRSGLFPMGVGQDGQDPLGWWSPDPRGVLPLADFRATRSLRQSARRYEVTFDLCFSEVVQACADPGRPGRWITEKIARAYQELHRLGWAHSVECWFEGELIGGLYGVAINGLFAGESMFHLGRDASKVALLALVEQLCASSQPERRLLDVQWPTSHLASLGVRAISRPEYLDRLELALTVPGAAKFTAATA